MCDDIGRNNNGLGIVGLSNHTNDLVWIIYGIILIYFILGGIGFYKINRNKSTDEARKSYLKFFTYFVIINILFLSIVIQPVLFRYLVVLIIGLGMVDLIRLYIRSGNQKSAFFILSLFCYFAFAFGFYQFSGLNYLIVLFGFLVVSIFDSFSQISGQLVGHKKILPRISPNKTVGGVLGGAVIALISSWFLGDLYEVSNIERLVLSGGIIIFAFFGDALASLYKRQYKVKDFSRMIPGHGGVLDRFDSLIAGGTWVAIYVYIL